MKTTKEIQLATYNFLRAFQQSKAHELAGTFIAANPSVLYQQHQFYLWGTVTFGLLFVYLFYNAWVVDEVYYWHIDMPVVVGILVIFLFLAIGIALFKKYVEFYQIIKKILENPTKVPYGVIITDEYYFENTPDSHHIIPRANIIKIDYEELRENGEIYLELLVELGDNIVARGVTYKTSEFDLKAWISSK